MSKPAAAELRDLNTIRELHPAYTLELLRRNRAEAVRSATQQPEEAMKSGDVQRAQMFLELAGAVETEGE